MRGATSPLIHGRSWAPGPARRPDLALAASPPPRSRSSPASTTRRARPATRSSPSSIPSARPSASTAIACPEKPRSRSSRPPVSLGAAGLQEDVAQRSIRAPPRQRPDRDQRQDGGPLPIQPRGLAASRSPTTTSSSPRRRTCSPPAPWARSSASSASSPTRQSSRRRSEVEIEHAQLHVNSPFGARARRQLQARQVLPRLRGRVPGDVADDRQRRRHALHLQPDRLHGGTGSTRKAAASASRRSCRASRCTAWLHTGSSTRSVWSTAIGSGPERRPSTATAARTSMPASTTSSAAWASTATPPASSYRPRTGARTRSASASFGYHGDGSGHRLRRRRRAGPSPAGSQLRPLGRVRLLVLRRPQPVRGRRSRQGRAAHHRRRNASRSPTSAQHSTPGSCRPTT